MGETREILKQVVAKAALSCIPNRCFLGVGSGTTMEYFVSLLPSVKSKIEACVPSSDKIAQLLRAQHLPVMDLSGVPEVHLYVDGADACNASRELIKGKGGGANPRKNIGTIGERICLPDRSR